MSIDPIKESIEEKIISVANKLKGYDYKSILKRELKNIEEPEELDIERMCKVILWHIEEKRAKKNKTQLQPANTPSQSTSDNSDVWLTREKAAEELTISKSTLKRRIELGDIKEYGNGRIKRIKKSDIQGFLKTMLGSAAPALCTESILYFVRKDFKILTFDKGKVYDIIYENAIWIYVYNKEWMDSIRLNKTQFRKYFSVKGEREYDAKIYGI